ncbi:MAG TPA: efflux RND transporter periplasmic adaptor subunit [Devosia sp.]|nr:efflux RND transporter periplasmic adaptor subunit [Devosia sp.]
MRLAVAAGAVLVVAGWLGQAWAQPMPPGAPGQTGPVQVGVITLKAQQVPITVELPGRISASASADVRPQVSGIIKSVNFRAGQQVKAGDVLYEIDDAVYQAQVALQSAAVQKAEAAVSTAQSTVTRDQQLAASSNIAASEVEAAQAALAEAKADVASAEANLKSAQINLGLTQVTAPIAGIIGGTSVNAGALVTASQTTALATIRQLDPAYVNVVETATNLLRVRAQFESGTLKGSQSGGNPTITVHLTLEDGTAYPQAGQMTFLDVAVSESTGTFSAQGTVPNPNRLLLPGMFVRATLDLGMAPSAFLVPQRAVTFDASGNPTALFAEGGKAVSHTLTTNGNSGNNWVVTGGISDGAKLIVDGLQKINPGSAVAPVEVTLDDNGVVVEPVAGGAPAAAAKPAGK